MSDSRDTRRSGGEATVLRGPYRLFLQALGTFAVALAVAGIFLPLVPTTPLLLLAAWCFARSSERFYRWLLDSRWLGPYIRDFRDGRGMALRAKASTLVLLWIVILATVGLVAMPWWAQIAMIAIAAGVSHYLLLRLPTRRAR